MTRTRRESRAWTRFATSSGSTRPTRRNPRITMRIGTRGSALARAQSEHVRALLSGNGPRHELVRIVTTGDRDQDTSLSKIGGKGIFTKEIETALLEGRIDLAVHSLKDLPTEETPGL